MAEVQKSTIGSTEDTLRFLDMVGLFGTQAMIALDGETRRRALTELEAPPFALPDLDGNLHALEEWHSQKKLLVAFASW